MEALLPTGAQSLMPRRLMVTERGTAPVWVVVSVAGTDADVVSAEDAAVSAAAEAAGAEG